ncbi:dienelactone hydrolase family protein [Actinomadura harenae]|uniref:Alpha/beta hydrolase n=1 Tax=Actinomadura harenae TaxID=2483351 RepID=A0A3M2LVJ5_9ACTN|nr:alpha/beta hydrolase [Actinomadura harenae]RMI38948.1 alpha/beta hydrolase [Actinomadura harenae]
MKFTTETSTDGVIERDFLMDDVTGVLWTPESPSEFEDEGAPLVLMGHSGGLDKRSPGLVARALDLVARHGFSVAAVDAPGHGDRPRNEQDRRWVDAMFRAREAGESIVPIVTEYNASLAERAVPEWRAVIDELQALPAIGQDAPIGYGGMTLGTAIGLLLTAADPRIRAASFGSVLVYDDLTEAAGRITVPVQFLLAWDDPEIPRETGLALFDAFASPKKTLHANPGRHGQTPWHEIESTTAFYRRNLTPLTPR